MVRGTVTKCSGIPDYQIIKNEMTNPTQNIHIGICEYATSRKDKGMKGKTEDRKEYMTRPL